MFIICAVLLNAAALLHTFDLDIIVIIVAVVVNIVSFLKHPKIDAITCCVYRQQRQYDCSGERVVRGEISPILDI